LKCGVDGEDAVGMQIEDAPSCIHCHQPLALSLSLSLSVLLLLLLLLVGLLLLLFGNGSLPLHPNYYCTTTTTTTRWHAQAAAVGQQQQAVWRCDVEDSSNNNNNNAKWQQVNYSVGMLSQRNQRERAMMICTAIPGSTTVVCCSCALHIEW
jgi:ABC-type transport system involved in cytochrome bd biosynthesis fused ATPase/permease subunit